MLNPEDVRHIQDYLRSLPNHQTPIPQPIDQNNLRRPKTAVVASPELYDLDKELQCNFPNVYDLIGGVEGLLMCVDNAENESITQACVNDNALYDKLSSEVFNAIDQGAELESELSGSSLVYDAITTEYVSWEFTEAIIKATRAYGEILRNCLAVFAGRPTTLRVIMLTKTPLKGVYLIRFVNEEKIPY